MHKKQVVSITLAEEVKKVATEQAKALGLNFSAYISLLIMTVKVGELK